MKAFKFAAAMFLVIFLAGEAWPLMTLPSKGGDGVKAERAKKSLDPRTAPAPTSSVRKVTHLVDKIEDGVLYTRGGEYSLKGVKVLDLTQPPKETDPRKIPKKTAEMTFVNDKLEEVVIRQRR